MKRIWLATLVLCLAAALPPAAQAQNYPSRPITMVVPWGAGGGTDAVARMLAALLEKELAQTSAQLKNVQGVLLSRNQQVNACEKRNTELYGLGRQLVAQCQDPNPARVSQLPQQLSGAKQVTFETLLEDYRDKLDAAHLLKADLAQ